MRSHLRSGAALIIVLLILLALMVLGLPFLFSQSSGLAGARSFQAAQAAHIYRQSAENLGLAIAAYTNEGAWKQTTGTDLTAQIHTALYLYLNDPLHQPQPLQGSLINENPNRLSIDAAKLPDALKQPGAWNQPGEDVRIGVTISDESGMLDANTLSPQDWQNLFKLPEINIPDWDDQQVQVTMIFPDSLDGDTTGELADGLVHRRLSKGRYTRLEELMDVDPQSYWRNHTYSEFRKRLSRAEIERLRPYLSFHNPPPGRNGRIDLGSVVFVDDTSNSPVANVIPPNVWRDFPPELLTDGQFVWTEPSPGAKPIEGHVRLNGNSGYTITYVNNGNFRPAPNSAMLWEAPPALNIHQISPLIRNLPAYMQDDLVGGLALPNLNKLISWYGAEFPVLTPALPTGYLHPWYHPLAGGPAHTRQPLDIRSSGSVRIEAAATIRNKLGDLTAQESRTVIMQAIPQETTLERRWLTQGHFEPLVAQYLTSQMVTWPHATARVSDITPNDVDPATTDTPKPETGISFKPNASLATDAKNITHLEMTWRSALGANASRLTAAAAIYEYRSGTDYIDGGQPVTDPNTNITPPTPTQTANHEGLFPDGVRIGANQTLAYSFSDALTIKGPLTWTKGGDDNGTMNSCQLSLWFQPQTEWYNSTSTHGEVITLLEARALSDYRTKIEHSSGHLIGDLDPRAMVMNTLGATDKQNYLSVQYDPFQNMLVLAYTPPSASCTTSPLPWFASPDVFGTPAWDDRCLPDPSNSLPLVPGRNNPIKMAIWSRTYQPNRIMTCYKLGRRKKPNGDFVANAPETGRWYHLQIIIGDGRPGGLGLILDGVSGTDVGLMSASQYVTSRSGSELKGPWPGDHLTFPSLILADNLTAVPKPILSATDAQPLYPTTGIKVEMPGFSSFANDDYSFTPTVVLTPADTLPLRGTALIGDEYIRYENISAPTTGYAWKLEYCTRGTRQNTYSDSTDQLEQAPTTQNHRIGDRVLADGLRFKPEGSDQLYRGGAILATPMLAGSDITTPTNRLYGAVSCPVVKHTIPFDINSGPVTIIPSTGCALNQPNSPTKGFVRYEIDGHLYSYYHFTRIGDDFRLSLIDTLLDKRPAFGGLGDLPGNPTINNFSNLSERIILISQELSDLNTNDPLLADSFPLGLGGDLANDADVHKWRLVQLLEPASGRCEWIRYTDIIKSDSTTFLLNRQGWGYPDTNFTVYPPNRNNRQRGCDRTPPPNGSILGSTTSLYEFPTNTLVLPVQLEHAFGAQARQLSPGDLITLVPNNYATNDAVALAIRYAANDGYDGSAFPLTDSVNERFAFCTPLRGLLNPTSSASDYQVVMGSGLSTLRDLSPLGQLSTSVYLSALPRLDAHESSTESGRLVFGSQDPDPERTTPPAGSTPSAVPIVAMDAFAAGPWINRTGRLKAIFDINAIPTAALPPRSIASLNDLPVYIWTTQEIFRDVLSTAPNDPCLIELGGEVFAAFPINANDEATIAVKFQTLYAKYPSLNKPTFSIHDNRNYFAKLVGRALLGSSSSPHPVNESVDENQLTDRPQNDRQKNHNEYLAYGQEVMRLPVGPVRFLTDGTGLTPTGNNTYQMSADGVTPSGNFEAPCALLAEPIRPAAEPWTAHQEIFAQGDYDPRLTLDSPDPNNPPPARITWPNLNALRWITPTWRRGMYNTDSTHNWIDQPGGHDKLHPLVIGWWTRFPSSLPSLKATSTSNFGDLTSQHLRCRYYPWAGFPFNLHGIRFDNLTADCPELMLDPTLPTNKVLTESDPNLQLEVRAMAGSVNGIDTELGAIAHLSGTSGQGYSDWSQITPSTILQPGASWVIPNLFFWNQAPLTDGPDKAYPTTGAEVRVTFRYTGPTTGTGTATGEISDLTDIARAANRAPLILGFKLRAHAPVATLAVEDAR